MFADARRFVGNLWGHTTTQLLALLVAVQPVLSAADPTLITSIGWLRWSPLIIAVAIAALRVMCPPPPSVPVQPEDTVHIDATNNLITIAKGNDIPPSVQKLAG